MSARPQIEPMRWGGWGWEGVSGAEGSRTLSHGVGWEWDRFLSRFISLLIYLNTVNKSYIS